MPLLTPLLDAAQGQGLPHAERRQMFNAQVDFITEFLLAELNSPSAKRRPYAPLERRRTPPCGSVSRFARLSA
jgi:hypothetical protein